MKCTYWKCKGQQNAVEQVANVGTLCSDCRTEIQTILKRQGNTIGVTTFNDYLDDYVKLFLILSTDALCLDKAQKLGVAISNHPQKKGLSFHLKRFETKCHFPDVEVIPTGVLSSSEFYDMIARGVMWKDVGAGLTHGLYAHRLQWHFVLAVITSDFTVAKAVGWDHGGYDLFVSLGEGDARIYNLWGKIFDASSQNCMRSPEEVEPALKDIAPITLLLEKKYEKYAKVYKVVMNYAADATIKRVNKQEITAKEANRVVFDLTDAIWGAYYFARRGIFDAIPQDLKEYRKFIDVKGSEVLEPGRIGFPNADDKSKRFSKDAIVLEHNNKILRVTAQAMPTKTEVTGYRHSSGANLKTV